MRISSSDIAWLAGLVEAEGSIQFKACPFISILMVDMDVIARAASLLGGNVLGPYEKKGGYKPQFGVRVYGKRAAGWIMTLLPLLGQRRRAQAVGVLNRWLAQPGSNAKGTSSHRIDQSAAAELAIPALPFVTRLHWLAGLLEGEASFGWQSTTPGIQMEMTDEDTIRRAHNVLGDRAAVRANPARTERHKPTLAVRVAGPRAAAWMMTIYSLMGERRRERIAEVLKRWRDLPGFPKASRGKRLPALCHPERKRVAFGMCGMCYQRHQKQQRLRPEGA